MRSPLWITLASALAVPGCSAGGSVAGDAGTDDATTGGNSVVRSVHDW